MIKVAIYSIVPSPYQRDLFHELSRLPQVSIKVFYLEPASPDSPWPEKQLQPYEQILPGGCLAWGQSRFHINWHSPTLAATDVVILNGYQNLTSQLILHYWAKRVPCVFWGEKIVAASSGFKGILQRQLMQGLDKCRAIAAIGSRAKVDYQQRFPEQLILNIPYYCDLSQFSFNPPVRPRQPITILCCGQMIPRKGVDLLLEAFQRLIEAGFKVRLLLVGREADLPQMLSQISDQAKQQIEYAGFQPPDQLPQFFRQADLFVLPSRYDGWGVVVNQALGAGLPIVCSDAVGAAVDLIEPGVNGWIVPAGDAEALYQALLNYLLTPQQLQTASQASLRQAANWLPEAGAKRWLEVLQTLCPSAEATQGDRLLNTRLSS